MKRMAGLLLLVITITSCTAVSAKITSSTHEPGLTAIFEPTALSPRTTTQLSLNLTSTPRPLVTPTRADLTAIFITQVMATKYAARTEYAKIPTNTPTPTIMSDSPACSSNDLTTSFSPNGAGGHIVLQVQVTDTAKTPCYLPSWPVVQLLDRSGNSLEITYDYFYLNSNPSSLPPTQQAQPGEPIEYGLEAGQSAVLLLSWGNWCGPAVKGGVVIRINLLGKAGWIDIPTEIEGGGHCDDPGSPSTIDVIGFGY